MNPERARQAEELFARALERDEERRAAFLHEACAGDDELRREVESLLAQEERAKSFLEEGALKIAAGNLASNASGSWIGRKTAASPPPRAVKVNRTVDWRSHSQTRSCLQGW
jgi:hypothetical protein